MQSGPIVPPPESVLDPLAVQVARLDERTLALLRDVAELRSEMRWLFGGLATLTTLGFTVLGLLLRRG